MRELTQEVLKETFHYIDGELFWKKGRKGIKINRKAGSNSSDGYIRIFLDGKEYRAHRLIFLYHNGFLPSMIDHINGVTTDNRIENLQKITASQNQIKSKINLRNKSGCKGVSWDKYSKKWCVVITVNKKNFHLGSYIEKEVAIKEKKKAEKKYYKDVMGGVEWPKEKIETGEIK